MKALSSYTVRDHSLVGTGSLRRQLGCERTERLHIADLLERDDIGIKRRKDLRESGSIGLMSKRTDVEGADAKLGGRAAPQAEEQHGAQQKETYYTNAQQPHHHATQDAEQESKGSLPSCALPIRHVFCSRFRVDR